MLGYAAADALCGGVSFGVGVGGWGWGGGDGLFMTASRPLRSLMVYLARDEAGYSVVRPMGWPRVVMV